MSEDDACLYYYLGEHVGSSGMEVAEKIITNDYIREQVEVEDAAHVWTKSII